MKRRESITRQMLILAKLKGWHQAELARQTGYAPITVSKACLKHGVELPLGVGGQQNPIQEPIADDTRVKAWSTSKAAQDAFFGTYGEDRFAVARYLKQKGARA